MENAPKSYYAWIHETFAGFRLMVSVSKSLHPMEEWDRRNVCAYRHKARKGKWSWRWQWEMVSLFTNITKEPKLTWEGHRLCFKCQWGSSSHAWHIYLVGYSQFAFSPSPLCPKQPPFHIFSPSRFLSFWLSYFPHPFGFRTGNGSAPTSSWRFPYTL